MGISYTSIRSERQWRASTGLASAQFAKLVGLFGCAYEELLGESLSERQKNQASPATFPTDESLLFFGLFSIKSGLSYDLLELGFDLAPSNAHATQGMCLSVLPAALSQGGYLPQRESATEEDFIEHWKAESDILLDATEQRVQRPGNLQDQKELYSGKKKPTP